MKHEVITLKACFLYTLDMFASDPSGFVSTGDETTSFQIEKEIIKTLLDMGNIWNDDLKEKETIYDLMIKNDYQRLLKIYHKYNQPVNNRKHKEKA